VGPLSALRLHVWNTLENPSYSRTAKIFSGCMLLTILISVLNFMITSMPFEECTYQKEVAEWSGNTMERVCGAVRLTENESLVHLETACIMIFTTEFVLRLVTFGSTGMPLWRHLLAPMNLLDLFAIAPWYLVLIAQSGDTGSLGGLFSVLRVVRLARVLRVFKVSRSFQSVTVLIKTVSRSSEAFVILVISLSLTTYLLSALIYIVEQGKYNHYLKNYIREDGLSAKFNSIPAGMYWCMTTFTTVGYGDEYPITHLGKFIASLGMPIGLIVLALPITIIGANFDEEAREMKRQQERKKRQQANLMAAQLVGGGMIPQAPLVGSVEASAAAIDDIMNDYQASIRDEFAGIVKKCDGEVNLLMRKLLIQSRVVAKHHEARVKRLDAAKEASPQPADPTARETTEDAHAPPGA